MSAEAPLLVIHWCWTRLGIMGKGLATLQADGSLLVTVGHLAEEQVGNLPEAPGTLAANVRSLVCVDMLVLSTKY